MLGTPILNDWPEVQSLPQYVEFEYREPMKIGLLFNETKGASAEMDFLSQFLKLNPLRRINALEVYFINNPSQFYSFSSPGDISFVLFC